MAGLEDKIKEIIERLYKCEYIGDLKVRKDHNLYILTLYLQNEPHACGGTTLANQCHSDEEFLCYVEKELKKNRLDYADYGQLRIYNIIEDNGTNITI